MEEPGKKYLREIIKVLGGKPEITEKYSTHFIISNTKMIDFIKHRHENPNLKNRKFYTLNLKWLFHCYFNVKRLDEMDPEYKIVTF